MCACFVPNVHITGYLGWTVSDVRPKVAMIQYWNRL